MTYNYKHFGFKPYSEESTGRFLLERLDGPKIGTVAPDFIATTLDKKKVRLSDFRGKIVVLEAGSGTCPATIGTTSDMQKLVRKYPDIVFLLLYVREAHPGERTPAHRTFEEKLACARRFKEEERDNRLVLVDDLEGTIHKQYGLFPNFVYVIDHEGHVVFRRPWNVPERLDETLKAISDKQAVRFPEAYELPKLRNVGFRAIRRAGCQAVWDLALNFPRGLYILYKLGRLNKMVETVQKDNRKLYQCPECGFHYVDKEWAEKCEAWCREHKSCNIEITAHAKENKKA